MTLLPATEADIPLIRAIAHATWSATYGSILSPAQMRYMLDLMYSEQALAEQMHGKGHHFMLFLAADGAQGFASYEHGYHDRRSTRLHKLYVLPGAQGTGAGRALLQQVIHAARNAGDTTVELNVNRFNPARMFYERHDFHIVRDEVIDIGCGFVMDDHVMELMVD